MISWKLLFVDRRALGAHLEGRGHLSSLPAPACLTTVNPFQISVSMSSHLPVPLTSLGISDVSSLVVLGCSRKKALQLVRRTCCQKLHTLQLTEHPVRKTHNKILSDETLADQKLPASDSQSVVAFTPARDRIGQSSLTFPLVGTWILLAFV